MLFIEENVIYLTRGDDGVLPVELSTGSGEYTMGEADVLTLTVREIPDSDSPVLICIHSNPGSNRLVFNSADSANVMPGEYSADIQITDGSGRDYTVWPELEGKLRYSGKNFKNFVVMPEVTV